MGRPRLKSWKDRSTCLIGIMRIGNLEIRLKIETGGRARARRACCSWLTSAGPCTDSTVGFKCIRIFDCSNLLPPVDILLFFDGPMFSGNESSQPRNCLSKFKNAKNKIYCMCAGEDGRLNRLCESMLMVLEAFAGFEAQVYTLNDFK